ncbi:hypothetical protein TRAPUB_7531 [Trametes pubescens]|uniref:Uncharacterized protein n=1 Tax=Trametes pubescens TaxID=154538 RepID=A0A1M2V380_TRAPU|nr:hypothetical protein TRAPUB_7531 [Trametes pubescens]
MAVSSHRIHTIHGAFGAPSCFAPSMPLSINSAQASSFHRLPNVCAPRSRPFRAVPGASNPASVSRTTPASSAPSIMGSSAAGSRPRRTSLSFSAPPTPTRRAPPPPPAPAERTASALRTTTTAPIVVEIPTIEDPFADAPEEPLDLTARTQVSTYTVPAAPAPRTSMEAPSGISAPPGLARTAAPSIPSARDIRGRLVASALLNRGSGRPLGVYLRRRLSGQEHVYVKSGLSQLVAVAA